jgi:hypothetical protein
MYGYKQNRHSGIRLRNKCKALPLLMVLLGASVHLAQAQTAGHESVAQQIQALTDAMTRTQSQLEQSQHQLDEMRKQLAQLQHQMSQASTATSQMSSDSISDSTDTAAKIQDIRERQEIEEAQIATHEQVKVESESKYPVKITGLILLNGFVNTGAVDIVDTPTVALPGSGSTGASVRQTILGFDARGPHLFGARSYADLRVDFNGSPASGSPTPTYSGNYSANAAFLRLRTAHAGLQWKHTETYFSLDRPIFSPDTPTSLTAVAEPALAWSGNLWTWNPQLGVTQHFGSNGGRGFEVQGALIDVGDAPLSPANIPTGTSTAPPPNNAEQSRWPGVEARVALLGSTVANNDNRNHFGIGGYFAPHDSSLLDHHFNSWAATLDTRLFLHAGLEFSASFYRGQALGGLGGGGYKDFAYRADTGSNRFYFRPLDDIGGWAQLKEKVSERVELNGAFGMDNVFSSELRGYAVPGGSMYQNLARNRTYTGNVIYSPSAYLLFSLEYRHLESLPVVGLPASSNIIGLGAGYKF